MSNDRILLALGAHVPWVRNRRPRADAYEQWLFTAITETLVPLAEQLEQLAREELRARLTLSLSPLLLEMLADPLLIARCVDELGRQIAHARDRRDQEPEGSRSHAVFAERERKLRATRKFLCEDCAGYLIAAFRGLAEAGLVELATSAASNAYLPLHIDSPGITAAQIQLGAEEFQRHIGLPASGFWLPGGGFRAELAQTLGDAGFRWVIVGEHGIQGRTPGTSLRGPIRDSSGLVAFPRANPISTTACSRTAEDPLDAPGLFEEFAAADGGAPHPESQTPSELHESATQSAQRFVSRCRDALACKRSAGGDGLLVVALEATWLGQRWPWGMLWLDRILRELAGNEPDLDLATPNDVLEPLPALPESCPSASSWSPGGYHESWIRGENDWVYPKLARAAERMALLCREHPNATGVQLRALNQCLRELHLAHSGDWAALMTREATADYAASRIHRHLADFAILAEQITRQQIRQDILCAIEARDNVFPAIDYRRFLDGIRRVQEGPGPQRPLPRAQLPTPS